jgi:hypothetical protein
MNNKGFAITGIIYTLFILFLMLLLAVLSLMKTYQRLIINSVNGIDAIFKGEEIADITKIKDSGITLYTGKYIFNVIKNDNTTYTCSTYLENGADIYNDDIILSPSICNTNIKTVELISVYSFEGES